MTSNKTEIESYLEQLSRKDPLLYTVLRLLSDDVDNLVNVVLPQTQQSILEQVNSAAAKSKAVDTFTYTTTPTAVRFFWTTSDTRSIFFEVRKGSVWDTAEFQFRTNAHQADINPILSGTTHFIIRSINIDGIISDDEVGVDVFVAGPIAPTLTYQVIDNNVLLSWTQAVSTFTVDYYDVLRNSVVIGQQSNTFFVYFELVPGTNTYQVRAVDIAGNVGPSASIVITVNEPPDFVLYDTRISNFGGTKTSVILEGGKLVGPFLSETWSNHFSTRVWNNIQDQVTAGYPIYGQPANVTGKYVETIDYGAVLSNTIVNVDWISNTIASTVGLSVQLESSLDNASWTTITAGPSVFYASFRYIRITLTFTSDNHGLIQVSQLRVFLDIKLVLTSGTVNCLAVDNDAATGSTHAGGKYVAFTKPYKDVDSITLTTNSRSPVTSIYDLIKTLDVQGGYALDGFKIYVFDSSGNRIDQTVSWKVRGRL